MDLQENTAGESDPKDRLCLPATIDGARTPTGWAEAMTVWAVPGYAALGFALLLLQACATPAERLSRQAIELGYTSLSLTGRAFRLTAFHKPAIASGKILHVYLEGDGSPWLFRDRVSADPTPRDPLMLRLMALDTAPALYLGRPCYLGHALEAGCSPLLWTHRRYAPEIVDAMADGLREFLKRYPSYRLAFFGHSGGGALALLLADRFQETVAVVTLAGNIDIDVWADYHGYSRLEGSLNPVRVATSGFAELHLLGGRDQRVPPRLLLPTLEMRRNARVRVIDDADHGCCWQALWPDILRELPEAGSIAAHRD